MNKFAYIFVNFNKKRIFYAIFLDFFAIFMRFLKKHVKTSNFSLCSLIESINKKVNRLSKKLILHKMILYSNHTKEET